MSDATPTHKPMSFKDFKPYDVFVLNDYTNKGFKLAIVLPESNKDYLYYYSFDDDTKKAKTIILHYDFKVEKFGYYLHTSYADDPILDTMNKFPEEFI